MRNFILFMKMLLCLVLLFIIPSILKAQNITYIDLVQAKSEKINSEKIFKDFELVPLETHEDALLNIKTATYYLTDKYIIAVSFLKGAYIFDRKTGKFIREVSSFGQGPNEYTGWIYNRYGFDERYNILYASDGANIGGVWKCINIETNKIESTIKKPLPKDESEFFSAYAPWRIKDNTYVSFCNNRTGKDRIKLVVFNKDGKVFNKFMNHLEYKKEISYSNPSNNGIFYYYKELTYFKEWNYNDTVFCVTENDLSPHIIFKLGNKQASYYHQDNADYNRGKYLINFVYESDGFVFFNFLYNPKNKDVANPNTYQEESVYVGYYDKTNKQAYISITSDYENPGYTINGIPDSFYPISINSNNEMIAKIHPEKLMRYKNKIDPKYKYLFEKMQEDDNPIIIIAKLKK